MNLEIYLQEIMRNVASTLMLPVMIVLVALILFAVYSIGALVAEFVLERRHFKANMPRDIKAIKDSQYNDLPRTIETTGLLRRQKEALQVIVANMGLPEDDLFALAKSEVSATDARYRRKVARTDLVTKIAPMMGLMCTLIPLGPGIVAMGQGEVNTLSNSLLVAFDGTVAGLIGGVVSMVVSSIRKRWYANYLVAMESLTTCVLEKAQEARESGVKLPYEGDVRARADAWRSGAAASFEGARTTRSDRDDGRRAVQRRDVAAAVQLDPGEANAAFSRPEQAFAAPYAAQPAGVADSALDQSPEQALRSYSDVQAAPPASAGFPYDLPPATFRSQASEGSSGNATLSAALAALDAAVESMDVRTSGAEARR